MKRIRTIRHWSAILLVLSGFMISVFLFSCSQEEEVPSNLYEYTPQQKEEIMALAEKYGLNIKFQEEKPEKPLPTVQEVEHFFQNLVTMMSKPHTLCLVKEGEVASTNLQVRTRAESTSETGSWQGTSYYDNDRAVVLVKLTTKWTLPTREELGTVNTNFEIISGSRVMFHLQIEEYNWGSDYEIFFKHQGDLDIGVIRYPIIISGTILTKAGFGSFSVY